MLSQLPGTMYKMSDLMGVPVPGSQNNFRGVQAPGAGGPVVATYDGSRAPAFSLLGMGLALVAIRVLIELGARVD